jgi:hypothetical protein
MNFPSKAPHATTRPTQTFWPGTRRPQPPPAPRTHDAGRDDKQDDEHAPDEPGYGHGV